MEPRRPPNSRTCHHPHHHTPSFILQVPTPSSQLASQPPLYLVTAGQTATQHVSTMVVKT